MNVSEILKLQSKQTWQIFEGSLALGEVIREDALTSMNLASINYAARESQINLSITSMQGALLEQEYGADWYWVLDNQIAQLIQAKKLQVAVREDLLRYAIDVPQLSTLLVQADILSAQLGLLVQPYYVFYNTLLSGQIPEDTGCVACHAEAVMNELESQGQLGQQSASLPLMSIAAQCVPWYSLF